MNNILDLSSVSAATLRDLELMTASDLFHAKRLGREDVRVLDNNAWLVREELKERGMTPRDEEDLIPNGCPEIMNTFNPFKPDEWK